VTKPISSTGWKVAAAFVAGAVLGAFSVVQVARNVTTTSVGQPDSEGNVPGLDGTTVPSPGATNGTLPPGAPGPGSTLPTAAGLSCARGQNGGNTDTGVTGTEIKMATTVVRSGIGAAFLGDVQFAMEAVRNKVNRAGGVCGRILNVRYVDDGWNANAGAQYLRNFIQEGVFAIPVGPSSEGLRVVIDSGDIQKAGIPVVGTDGMIINQYEDSWVWPVAVATASSARIMVRNAHGQGAKRFAIVFDNNYKFGVEAATAFNNEVKRLTGSNVDGFNTENNCVRSFCGIIAGRPGYGNEVNEVASQDFDFLGMFLEPQTALTWMSTPGAPTMANKGGLQKPGMIGLAQPLFTHDLAVNCQSACDQMWVWTGYKPPIEDYRKDPVVQTFVSDLKKTKPDADEFNAFAEGGYVGMSLLVEALKKVGPQLTRARLKTVLDSMDYASGLTLEKTLSWRPGNHFAAVTMQAFQIEYKGSFGGWRAQTIVKDPSPQLGTG
jgi:ABC-type branched-subunit amino acid transport system substrate-binding protein